MTNFINLEESSAEQQSTAFSVEIVNRAQVEKVLEGDDSLPIFVLLAGTSESGKSTIGKIGLEGGYASRIKYLKVSSDILSDQNPGKGIIDILSEMEDPTYCSDKQYTAFVDIFIDRMIDLTGMRGGVSVVETLKHPRLVDALNKSSRARVLSVFVDADFELRVDRETAKTGLGRDIIAKKVTEKDETKGNLGLKRISEMSDIIIKNDGTYEEYYGYVENFLSVLTEVCSMNKDDGVIEYS